MLECSFILPFHASTMLRTNNTNNKREILTRFKTLINNTRCFCSSSSKEPGHDQSSVITESDFSLCRERFAISKWKTYDARKLGITSSMVSRQSQFVLKLLQDKGFKSYLVGGCVRDLLLNRTPKDFDVITRAKLTEVKKQLRRVARAEVVGRRFPVCLVNIKGSVVEVTSFDTKSKTSKAMEKVLHSLLPECIKKEDRFLSKNSLRRDFTINSLFYDPFANKIYDYANGMDDLRSLKLETLLPAQISFKEDPGRILRGFRIAARLGLSLSREIEAAIWTCSSLVKDMNKDRIMIELNYMLSYGAAKPSLRLLWKFKLLHFLLPVHAAYLDEQAIKEDAQDSNMLMKLFFHLDNLVGCDRPSECTLWIALLVFHMALANNPQDAHVVWALASVLYHGEWEAGIKFVNEHAKMYVNFAPEIKSSGICKSDDEIAKDVTKLASLAIESIHTLCPHMVFVSRKAGIAVSEIFKVLLNDIKFYKRGRKSAKINYDMLGSGHTSETRFVLGKIVLETMRSGIVGDMGGLEAEKHHFKTEGTKDSGQLVARKDKRKVLSTPNLEHQQEKSKKQILAENPCIAEEKTGLDELTDKETNEEHQNPKLVDLFMQNTMPNNKSSQTKQLKNDKKISSASKSSTDYARHLNMDEHRTSSKPTVSNIHQVIGDSHTIQETDEEHQKPVKWRQKLDLDAKNSMPENKSSNRKRLINDRKKIASASTSSVDHARHLKMDEHCKSSQSLRPKNNQVIDNNHNINGRVTTDKSVDDINDINGHVTTDKSVDDINGHVSTNKSVDEVVYVKGRQQPHKSKKHLSSLSSLFKVHRR